MAVQLTVMSMIMREAMAVQFVVMSIIKREAGAVQLTLMSMIKREAMAVQFVVMSMIKREAMAVQFVVMSEERVRAVCFTCSSTRGDVQTRGPFAVEMRFQRFCGNPVLLYREIVPQPYQDLWSEVSSS